MAFEMEHSTSKGKSLTHSDLEKISYEAASWLERSLSEIVFRDEETGEEYRYTPSAEHRSQFAESYMKFLESRFNIVEGV